MTYDERKRLAMSIATSVSDSYEKRRETLIKVSHALGVGSNSVECGVGGGYTDHKVVQELSQGCKRR